MKGRASRILALLTVLAAVTLQPAQAQEVDVIVGVKGGLSISDVTFEGNGESEDTNTRTGFIGGAFLTLGLGEIFAVQPEVLYAQKGAELDDPDFPIMFELAYIEIPVLLMARINVPNSYVRPLVFAGGAISFETGCELSGSEGGVSLTVDCDDPDISLERKTTDFGLVFGGGVEVEAGRIVLTADGRYNLGLVDLDEEPDFSAKNRAFSFMAGVGIRIP